MKVSSVASSVLSAALLAATQWQAQAVISMEGQRPMQTFFIPLPEESAYHNMFKLINGIAKPPIISFVSISISTDNTVIWYDHWEDGYEDDVTKPTSPHTEIWGDGDASNGCAPIVTSCTDSNDKLKAGDVIVTQRTVALPRNPDDWTDIHYDGGDMIQASYPIAITRGAYPTDPGSLMAGGVEVLDTDNWGTEFIAPVGQNVAHEAFEYTAMFVMAGRDGTMLTLPNGNEHFLNKGVGLSFRVNQGDQLKSSKPVQVHLITGDVNSAYELRWFSLISVDKWSNDYMSPTGDTFGKAKVVVYNPTNKAFRVRTFWVNANGVLQNRWDTANAGKHFFSRIIPTGSGARFVSENGESFFALSFTDTERQSGGSNQVQQQHNTHGDWYDWGFPLVPTNMLTPQVLVGWGYGCTNNKCGNNAIRSVVWLAPVETADIYIDYQNIGKDYTVRRGIKQYQGIKITDPKDKDMSGAVIFGTKPGSGPEGEPIDIAVSWGQDASVSRANQPISMDLGTVVLPFSGIRVAKLADKTVINPDETIRYTIRVMNVGQTDIPAGDYNIVDPEMVDQVYVPGTTTYSVDGGITLEDVEDDAEGTPFPLDGEGLPNKYMLPRRGGMHDISFTVALNLDTLEKRTVVNQGHVQRKSGTKLPFEASVDIQFSPAILIENTVYIGQDGGASCNTDKAVEMVRDVPHTPVTYCFKVTNTGNTHLKNLVIDNPELVSVHQNNTILAPGASYTVAFETSQVDGKPLSIKNDLVNVATVTGIPAFASGASVSSRDTPVRHSDPSEVRAIPFNAQVLIDNVVFAGNGECDTHGADLAVSILNNPCTYCFTVTNNGNSHLKSFKVTNGDLSYQNSRPDVLAPGESYLLTVDGVIDRNFTNTAVVVAQPCMEDGTAFSSDAVTDEDDSEVRGRLPLDGTARSSERDPFKPDTPGSCMTPHWRDAGNTQDLVCRADDIKIVSLTSDRATCTKGETVTISVAAELLFKSALYDPAWFVATDGGDAKLGTCVLKALETGNTYTVTDPDGSGTVVGRVLWNSDAKGGNDKCGDVIVDGGSALVHGSFLYEVEMKCVDSNDDGTLDFAVCFSWRKKQTDSFCTLTNDDINTQGILADVYPANNMGCRCVRAELPYVTVEDPNEDTPKIC